MKEICSTTKCPKTCRSKRSADKNCKKHSERSPHPNSGASIKGTFSAWAAQKLPAPRDTQFLPFATASTAASKNWKRTTIYKSMLKKFRHSFHCDGIFYKLPLYSVTTSKTQKIYATILQNQRYKQICRIFSQTSISSAFILKDAHLFPLPINE